MIVGMPRQLYDGLVKYDDGTKASTPQMAHDIAVFIDYMENHFVPDIRLNLLMIATALGIWFVGSLAYVKYHEINCHSCD